MTYLESAAGTYINRNRAFAELKRHGVQSEWLEFLNECITWPDTKLDDEGDIVSLDAQKLLAWLGY